MSLVKWNHCSSGPKISGLAEKATLKTAELTRICLRNTKFCDGRKWENENFFLDVLDEGDTTQNSSCTSCLDSKKLLSWRIIRLLVYRQLGYNERERSLAAYQEMKQMTFISHTTKYTTETCTRTSRSILPLGLAMFFFHFERGLTGESTPVPKRTSKKRCCNLEGQTLAFNLRPLLTK